MAKTIWISSLKLINTLRISGEELLKIENFFDSDPNDKWNLEPGKDYRVINQASGLREYTDTGAYAIAAYLEDQHKAANKGFIGWIKELVRKLKGDVRKVFVREKILYNSSSLIKRSDLFFLSESDVVSIFGTRRDYFRRIFDLAQKEEKPLEVNEDYDDTYQEGMRFYSLSGILKLSIIFHRELTNKNRKEWCQDAGNAIYPFVKELIKHHEKRQSRITQAKKSAKTRDKMRCRVTGQSPGNNAVVPIKLAAHHLYSAAHYPHLAESIDNIITIREDIHDHFHLTLGGKGKLCTIDHFIDYVKEHYPENLQLITWLHGQKAKIPSQPLSKDAPMVLYLPPNRITQNN